MQIIQKLPEEFDVFWIETLDDNDSRKPIVEYLRNCGNLTEWTLKCRANNYTILNNELYKKSHEGVMLRCLGKHEPYLAMVEVHNGIMDLTPMVKKMKWILYRKGYHWPTIALVATETREQKRNEFKKMFWSHHYSL